MRHLCGHAPGGGAGSQSRKGSLVMADDVKTPTQPDYSWPAPEQRPLLGKRISRVDGPVKVSGRAKYTYDIHRTGMLFGKVLRCPYAHAKVVSVDTSAAEKVPGVKAVYIVQDAGSEIYWARRRCGRS